MNNINKYEYSMNAEKNVSTVLMHFNLDYVMSVIDEALLRRNTSYAPSLPNIIDATEQHFRIAVQSGSLDENDIEEFDQARMIIYEQTIDKLCNSHGLNKDFNFEENIDIYTVARTLYDFLVSNFKTYMVSFFSHYININQMSIYKSMGLDKFKKDKDSTTMFGKISYDNQIITIISANIEHVLYNMSAFDISLDNIVCTIYDSNTANFINSIISSDNFYKDVYMNTILNPMYGPLLITDIRLMLHNSQDLQRIDIYEK